MKVVIKRGEWQRGEPHTSRLLRGDGTKCCLGFYCLTLGASQDDILGRGTPVAVLDSTDKAVIKRIRKSWTVEAGEVPSEDCYEAMRVNDSPDLPDDVREQKIAEIFERHGDEAVFVW